MSGFSEKRDPDRARWAVAITALLSEPTIAAAAKRSGVSEATLRRWRKHPRFVAAYRAARRQVVEAAVSRLQAASAKAAETLERNLACGVPAVEIRAASTVIDLAVKGCLDDLESRIEELERKAAMEQGE